VLVQLRVKVMMHPWLIVQTQESTLSGSPARRRVTSSTSTSQGEVVYWSAATLKGAHQTLSERVAGGATDPRDLLPIPITPTHAYNFMYRVLPPSGRLPGVEFHEGNTDNYFVVSGTATLMTRGTVEGFKQAAGRRRLQHAQWRIGRFPILAASTC